MKRRPLCLASALVGVSLLASACVSDQGGSDVASSQFTPVAGYINCFPDVDDALERQSLEKIKLQAVSEDELANYFGGQAVCKLDDGINPQFILPDGDDYNDYIVYAYLFSNNSMVNWYGIDDQDFLYLFGAKGVKIKKGKVRYLQWGSNGPKIAFRAGLRQVPPRYRGKTRTVVFVPPATATRAPNRNVVTTTTVARPAPAVTRSSSSNVVVRTSSSKRH